MAEKDGKSAPFRRRRESRMPEPKPHRPQHLAHAIPAAAKIEKTPIPAKVGISRISNYFFAAGIVNI